MICSEDIIYLDYAATTPVDDRVAKLMCECMTREGVYANPASRSHQLGRDAQGRVELARREIARLLGACHTEVVWTSGATESDNLALKGVAHSHMARGRHVVTSKTEHKAVLDTACQLQKEGCEVSYLVPADEGRVTPEQVREAIRDDTVLVSIMHVNNETGVASDITAIGRECRERGVLFHVDAAQSAGKLPIDVDEMNVDLMSVSGHKVYGPKGIGALYVRSDPSCWLEPIIHGGGHERGMRSGTLPTHQIVGMGEAFRIAREEMAAEAGRLAQLRDRLWTGLSHLGGVLLNGHRESRIPGILNVSFEGVEGESLLFALRELAVSSGSACTSASRESSYVLRALGRSDQLAQSSIRFSIGRYTTGEEIDRAIRIVSRQVHRLRGLAPSKDLAGAREAG
jgi:cysteine desulfurase